MRKRRSSAKPGLKQVHPIRLEPEITTAMLLRDASYWRAILRIVASEIVYLENKDRAPEDFANVVAAQIAAVTGVPGPSNNETE